MDQYHFRVNCGTDYERDGIDCGFQALSLGEHEAREFAREHLSECGHPAYVTDTNTMEEVYRAED